MTNANCTSTLVDEYVPKLEIASIPINPLYDITFGEPFMYDIKYRETERYVYRMDTRLKLNR